MKLKKHNTHKGGTQKILAQSYCFRTHDTQEVAKTLTMSLKQNDTEQVRFYTVHVSK